MSTLTAVVVGAQSIAVGSPEYQMIRVCTDRCSTIVRFSPPSFTDAIIQASLTTPRIHRLHPWATTRPRCDIAKRVSAALCFISCDCREGRGVSALPAALQWDVGLHHEGARSHR